MSDVDNIWDDCRCRAFGIIILWGALQNAGRLRQLNRGGSKEAVDEENDGL